MPEKSTLRAWMKSVRRMLKQLLETILSVIVGLVTLPYYRLFHFNTLKPIKLISSFTFQSDSTGRIIREINRWRGRKLSELYFIFIAGAIIAAANIGSFAWTTAPQAYWLASVFWYNSLIFAIAGVFLSAGQTAVLDLLGPLQLSNSIRTDEANVRRYLPLMLREIPESRAHRMGVGKWEPRWKMAFTWQCPMMFLSYSFSQYILGTTMFVCTPLINGDEWSTNSDIAVIYLAVLAITGFVFVFCSFWVYHYVDLDQDVLTTDWTIDIPRERM